MAPSKRKPPARDRRLSESVVLGGFDFLRDNPQACKKQAQPHRTGFARDMVFAEFGYRHARALDPARYFPSRSTATPPDPDDRGAS